jgi:hypothetical protein
MKIAITSGIIAAIVFSLNLQVKASTVGIVELESGTHYSGDSVMPQGTFIHKTTSFTVPRLKPVKVNGRWDYSKSSTAYLKAFRQAGINPYALKPVSPASLSSITLRRNEAGIVIALKPGGDSSSVFLKINRIK